MELELGLNFLLQSLPVIAQIFTALQEEKVVKLKHEQALEMHQLQTGKMGGRPDRSESKKLETDKFHQLQGPGTEAGAKEQKIKFQSAEVEKILDHWPLRLLPSQILTSQEREGTIPLKIFLSPPQVSTNDQSRITQFLPDIEPILAQSLGEFLSKHYRLNDLERPTEFLANAWKSKKVHREASIKAVFEMLKSEPTLILETEILGDSLSFRFAYWGLGQKNYCYKTLISQLNYRQILEESAINRALKWQKIAEQLLASGENPQVIAQLGGDNAFNLELLEKSQKWQQCGIDISELALDYQINRKDFEELCQFLASYHCLVAAWIADAHHLIHSDITPQLPELLPTLTQKVSQQDIVQEMIEETLKQLEAEHSLKQQKVSPPSLAKKSSLLIYPQVKPALQTVFLNRTLTGHSGKAASLAISRDGRTIASGSDDSTIKLWDLKTGELLHTLHGNSGRILTLTLSPDGQTLASSHRTSEKSTINVWNLPSGELIHTLAGHKKWIYTLAINPKGNTLVSGGYKIKIWDLQTGELQQTLTGHDKWIYSLTISPDSQTLASCGGDKTIKIWQLQTGELLTTLNGHSDWVRTIAISPDGQFLVSGGDDNSIKLWHLKSGKLLRTLTGHSDWVLSLAISPDGETIISGSRDHTIKIWQLSTGKLLSTLTGHKKWVYSLAISPDGQTLASGSEDKTVKIWQAV